MAARRGHREAVPRHSARINDHRVRVAAQAMVTGIPAIRVEAATPLAGPGHGQIAVRVGRLLVYVNDRDALDSFLDAWHRAAELADKAFGPMPAAPARRRRP